MGLYREAGPVVYHLPAAGPPIVPARRYATARGRTRTRKPRKVKAPAAGPARPVPGQWLLELTTGWCHLSDRREIWSLRRRPFPWECDPYAIWNCLGLGHWTAFGWTALIAELMRRKAG